MAAPVMLVALLGAFLLLGGKKKKKTPLAPPPPGASPGRATLDPVVEACIAEAAPKVGDQILWSDEAEKQAWVVKLRDVGLSKTAQCVGFEGADLASCMPILNDAITTDLRGLARELSAPEALRNLSIDLAGMGFPEAAACFELGMVA